MNSTGNVYVKQFLPRPTYFVILILLVTLTWLFLDIQLFTTPFGFRCTNSATKERMELVTGTFIWHKTRPEVVNAIHQQYINYEKNCDAKCSIKNVFFLGHPNEGLFPLKESHSSAVVRLDMNDTIEIEKSIAFLHHGVTNFPNAQFFFKRDEDTALNLENLCDTMINIAARNASLFTYYGFYMNSANCDGLYSCPPIGCGANFENNCWFYMQGGFYGLSRELAKGIISSDSKAFLATEGYQTMTKCRCEDLLMGRLIKNFVDSSHTSISTNFYEYHNNVCCHKKKMPIHRTSYVLAMSIKLRDKRYYF